MVFESDGVWILNKRFGNGILVIDIPEKII